MKINAYLYFNGNCKEAFDFYASVLNGKLESHPYSENKEFCEKMPAELHNQIMHVSLTAGDILLMGSDVLPSGEYGIKINFEGSPVNLSLTNASLEEQEAVFKKLSSGGKITMPLQDTFWGAKFGMLTDKFGIRWMFNFYKTQQ